MRLREIIKTELWDKYYTPTYTTLEPVKIKKHYKISICTTCMDRLAQLKETYIKNIEDNINYPNLEFVLLNYNSKDDLDTWAISDLKPYIDKGIVNYLITTRQMSLNITACRTHVI